MSMSLIIDAVYFVTAAIFIIGLKQMSSPVTAHRGIVWAGIAMVVASVATFGAPQISLDIGSINLQLMLVAIIYVYYFSVKAGVPFENGFSIANFAQLDIPAHLQAWLGAFVARRALPLLKLVRPGKRLQQLITRLD